MRLKVLCGLITAVTVIFACCFLFSCEETGEVIDGEKEESVNIKKAIEIATAEDLMKISEKMDGDYVLVNDIDLSSYPNWEPIGGAYGENIFVGTLYGDGHSISGLRRASSITEKNSRIYFGLFGQVGGNGKIVDLTLKDVYVTMTGPEVNNASTKVFCGAFAGAFYGTAESLRVESGTVSYSVCTNGCAYTGGLFGLAIGATVKDCSNNAAVVSGRYAGVGGGICGYASNSGFENCKNTGSISSYCTSFGGAAYSGGIVGEAFSKNPNTYTFCESTGHLSYDYYGNFDASSSFGGVLGWISGGALDWSGDSSSIEAHKVDQLFQ